MNARRSSIVIVVLAVASTASMLACSAAPDGGASEATASESEALYCLPGSDCYQQPTCNYKGPLDQTDQFEGYLLALGCENTKYIQYSEPANGATWAHYVTGCPNNTVLASAWCPADGKYDSNVGVVKLAHCFAATAPYDSTYLSYDPCTPSIASMPFYMQWDPNCTGAACNSGYAR
jgi:hypothetical protein